MFLPIQPASMRMSETTTSRKVYSKPESNSMGFTRRTITGQQLYREDARTPGYPNSGCSPGGAGDTMPPFCRQRLLPCAQGPRSHSWSPQHHFHPSKPAFLTKAWQGPGAALSWHWQPPAGTFLGAAALCPLEKGSTIRGSGPVLAGALSTSHFRNKQNSSALVFSAGSFHFFLPPRKLCGQLTEGRKCSTDRKTAVLVLSLKIKSNFFPR